MFKRLLLIVENHFYLRDLGLVLAPEVSAKKIDALQVGECISISVMLKYPNGTTQTMQARFQFVHLNPGGFKVFCSLGEIDKNQVPLGTEVWQICC